MKSKTVTAGAAAVVTLANAAGDAAMHTVVVSVLSGTAAEYVSFTVATNGVVPTTAVAGADDVLSVMAGKSVPVNIGSTDEVQVSVVAESGTPEVQVIGL